LFGFPLSPDERKGRRERERERDVVGECEAMILRLWKEGGCLVNGLPFVGTEGQHYR
jgi:hypothetical protein